MKSVHSRFGSFRGMIRLALSYAEVQLGHAYVNPPQPESIRRLVFVCHGNICRSAFAHWLATTSGMNAASFGLSASSGSSAHPVTLDIANAMGVDLAGHVATHVDDFRPNDGDFLLAMEVRQLRLLSSNPRLVELPRSLLGLWARPVIPHLHDPYALNDAYMKTCLKRIENSVENLMTRFPNARSCER